MVTALILENVVGLFMNYLVSIVIVRAGKIFVRRTVV